MLEEIHLAHKRLKYEQLSSLFVLTHELSLKKSFQREFVPRILS